MNRLHFLIIFFGFLQTSLSLFNDSGEFNHTSSGNEDSNLLIQPPTQPPDQPNSTTINNYTRSSPSSSSPTETTTIITIATTTTITTTPEIVLPPKGSQEQEKHYSLTIFFILFILAFSICLVHLLLQTKFNYLPDSIAVVIIGALVGMIMKILEVKKVADWKSEESFPPTMFFLILLPPIIFESGYNLHKGNFFQNIGTILLFAIFGTCISAIFVGGSIYLLGMIDLVYKLTLVQSFAFGSLISAVDPVATLAIFHAIQVDEVLYMMVFGESVLNDAVSIVLTETVLESSKPAYSSMSGVVVIFLCVGRFCMMFFASAAIGAITGLISSLFLKFVDLRRTPSLEFAMIMIFSYTPYALAEGIHLSGIMAILFCGIVMSHYTHLNLSPVCQIATQLTFRTVAFVAETCVFAYLGLAIFSFPHVVKPSLVIWSIILILLGRAVNILPLSYLANHFREHKLTPKMQFIMWFSGLRGAVSFALSLHLELEQEAHHVIVSTTLIVVIFTIICLGGSTMPLMKYMNKRTEKTESRLTLSKTKELGEALDSEYFSELTEEEDTYTLRNTLKGFAKIDAKFFIPFFTRRFTKQEVEEGQRHMSALLRKWHDDVREEEEEEDGDDDDDDLGGYPMGGGNGGGGGGGGGCSKDGEVFEMATMIGGGGGGKSGDGEIGGENDDGGGSVGVQGTSSSGGGVNAGFQRFLGGDDDVDGGVGKGLRLNQRKGRSGRVGVEGEGGKKEGESLVVVEMGGKKGKRRMVNGYKKSTKTSPKITPQNPKNSSMNPQNSSKNSFTTTPLPPPPTTNPLTKLFRFATQQPPPIKPFTARFSLLNDDDDDVDDVENASLVKK